MSVAFYLTYRWVGRVDDSPYDNILIVILGWSIIGIIIAWAFTNGHSEENSESHKLLIQQYGLTHDLVQRMEFGTRLFYLPVLLAFFLFLNILSNFSINFNSPEHTSYEQAVREVADERIVLYLNGITGNGGANPVALGLFGLLFSSGLLILLYSFSTIKVTNNAETRKLILGSRILFFWVLINSIPFFSFKPSEIECTEYIWGGWECVNLYNTKSLVKLHSILLLSNFVFLIGVVLLCQSNFFVAKNVNGKIPLTLFLSGFVIHTIFILSNLFSMNTRAMEVDLSLQSLYLVVGLPFLILFAFQFRKTLRMLDKEFLQKELNYYPVER